MNKYQKIIEETQSGKKGQQAEHTAFLYTSIYKDVVAILRIVLPGSNMMAVASHMKSIMYSLIELKTGQRPRKF